MNFSMMERKLNALFIGMFLVIVFSPSLVFAQQVETHPLILPDNFFYNFKLILENLQESITIQEDRKAELFLKHAEERDREARALEVQGKTIPIEKIKQIQADKILRAEQIILRLQQTQKIIDERQDAKDERDIISQARTDAQRAVIQDQIRIQNDRPQFTESPDNSRPVITGSIMLQKPEQVIEIVPVRDITDTDDSSEILIKLRDRLANAFTRSEITELRSDFQELVLERDIDRKRFLADQLDDEINNPIVSITCFGNIDSFSLSVAPNAIDEIQEQCPILRPIPDAELKKLANGFGS